MKMSVTYSVGTSPEKITEIVEVNDWGPGGAMAALRRKYPNKQITLHSCHEIH